MNGVLLLAASLACGQYLPDDDQSRLRDMWDAAGVEFPPGMKFYKLTDVSQRHVTVNGRRACGIYDTNRRGNVNHQDPWATPAGLNFSPKSQWGKAAAILLPGKVEVWREEVDVFNGSNNQTEHRWSWGFPDGTQVAEMLTRKWNGAEWAFEIRVREKRGGKWDDGVTYRPYTASSLPAGTAKHLYRFGTYRRDDFGVTKDDKVYVHELPDERLSVLMRYRLRPSRTVVTASGDDAFVPRGYVGTMTSCANCHSRAGDPTSYGSTGIRGSDTVFSFHPFTLETLNTDDDPTIDGRWAKRWRR